jgi:hypothetical protein
MHNELRYLAKKHAKSEKLSKERNKVLHLLPNFFYFFILLKNNKQKNNKDMLMEKEMT